MKKFLFRGKALTIKEPWASAIAYAGKDIENRDWRTHYRGPVAIHAGAAFDKDVLSWPVPAEKRGARKELEHRIRDGLKRHGRKIADVVCPSHFVAIAMLVDCIDRSSSPWFSGDFGFVFEGIIPIVPVPSKGALSLWDCKFHYQPL